VPLIRTFHSFILSGNFVVHHAKSLWVEVQVPVAHHAKSASDHPPRSYGAEKLHASFPAPLQRAPQYFVQHAWMPNSSGKRYQETTTCLERTGPRKREKQAKTVEMRPQKKAILFLNTEPLPLGFFIILKLIWLGCQQFRPARQGLVANWCGVR
jgi:hypothetical protein